MREQTPYESTIERDLLFFLEYDPSVVRYQAQPFAITGSTADGASRTYIPDFQVIRTESKEIVECKKTSHLNNALAQQQLALGQAWADANQHLFVLITDTDLRTGHRLANLKLLWRYSRLCVPPPLPRDAGTSSSRSLMASPWKRSRQRSLVRHPPSSFFPISTA
jgi:hypothetical protein